MSKQQVAVVTDSTAYLSQEALNGLRVPVIPLWLIWGEERYRDGVDIDPETFYERLQDAQSFPTTSQPSVGEFVDFYHRVAEEMETDTIVGAFISSGISGTVSAARSAKKQISDLNVTVIDSRTTAMGLGFVTLAAARIAASGGSVDEVVAAARKVQESLTVLFVVDTLEYLHRGGRIGGAKRLLGSALNIKPLLDLESGCVEPLCQVRTKRRAVRRLLDVADERLNGDAMVEACVVDIDSPKEGGELAQRVDERFHPDRVYQSAVSPVIGAHAGPGTVGLGFYTDC